MEKKADKNPPASRRGFPPLQHMHCSTSHCILITSHPYNTCTAVPVNAFSLLPTPTTCAQIQSMHFHYFPHLPTVWRPWSMNTRISLEEIANALNISTGSASSILRNRLSYPRVCARWITHILTPQPKRDRVAYSTMILKMYKNCNPRHLDELVTSDETWLYYFEPLSLRKAMNKPWVPKGGDMPQIVRRQYFTYYCFDSKGIVLQKPHVDRKEHHTTETVFFQNWTITTKKLDQSKARVETSFFI